MDDEKDVRETTADILMRPGYTFKLAEDGVHTPLPFIAPRSHRRHLSTAL